MSLPDTLLRSIDQWESDFAGAMAGDVVRTAWEAVRPSHADDVAAVGHELTDLTCASCRSIAAFPIRRAAPIVRCLECGLDRLLPRLTPSGGEILHNVRYDRSVPEHARDRVQLDGSPYFFEFELSQIAQRFPELKAGARGFEVGVWGGDFAIEMRKIGVETTGIDVWPPSIALARHRGIDAHLVSFNDIPAMERLNLQGVGFVCFRDAIQMVHGLADGLAFLKRVCKPGFALYIKCHVSDSAVYLGDRDPLYRYTIAVQSLFTSFSLTSTLERHGFEILAMAGQSPLTNYVNSDRVFVFARHKAT